MTSASTAPRPLIVSLGDYLALTKPRVMSLLLVTALTGLVLASEGMPGARLLISVLAGGALASGGAAALNHSYEDDLDRRMGRTRMRPVATGRISPRNALYFGLAMNVAAFAVLAAGANLLAAVLALAGTAVYFFVYTVWLKRTTAQNIVIGGAAGAIPPLVGWAAATGSLALPAWYLFTIIFFWTPPHFWALALVIKNDYARAGVPMLPVVEGDERTRVQIVLYSLLLGAVSVLMVVATPALGVIYAAGAGAASLLMVLAALRLWRSGTTAAAWGLYRFSLLFMFVLCAVTMADAAIR